MQLRDISFPTPQENLAFDDCLLRLAESTGQGYLRFWESAQVFVVLGRISQEAEDVDSAAVKAAHIPVLRRSSGGGTVVQGPGCLNYSLILSKQKYSQINDLRRSYEWISAQIVQVLGALGIQAAFKPISDLATGSGEKKFSGNAQKRGRNYILHHGTILYNFDLTLIPKYLNMPKDVPDYRKGRRHTDFVTNIPLAPRDFKSALAAVFQIDTPSQPLNELELSALKEILK